MAVVRQKLKPDGSGLWVMEAEGDIMEVGLEGERKQQE